MASRTEGFRGRVAWLWPVVPDVIPEFARFWIRVLEPVGAPATREADRPEDMTS